MRRFEKPLALLAFSALGLLGTVSISSWLQNKLPNHSPTHESIGSQITRQQPPPVISIKSGLSSGGNLHLSDHSPMLYQMLSGDPGSEVGPEVVSSAPWIDQTKVPFRYSAAFSDFWFKFVLNNDTYDFENFVLYHGSDFTVEQMQLYLVVENMPVLIGVAGISGGANRTSMLRLAAFDIDIPAQKSAEFMLRVKTKDPFVPDFVLEDRNSMYLDLQHENLAFGGFLGVAAVMVVFIGIFAYLLRDPLFGWFTALALLLILNSLVEFGFRESIATMSLGGLSSKQILHLTRPFFIVLLAQIAFTSGFSRHGRVANRPRLILMGLVANFVGISIARILGLGRYIDANIYSAFDGLMVASMIVFSVSAYDAKTRSARWFFPSLGLIFVASQCRWLTQLNVYRFDHHLIFLAPILEMGAIVVIVYGLILKIKAINSAKIAAEFEAGKNEGLKTLLRVVSHDINNSLTVAQAYAFKGSAIMAKEGHEEGQKYFSKILTACKNQSEIITNIRMLRAIEDGKTDIQL